MYLMSMLRAYQDRHAGSRTGLQPVREENRNSASHAPHPTTQRAEYKTLMTKTTDPKLRNVHDQRQAALKWCLVTSFGYLGYRNARFGKIDAHIGVCAFARKV